MKTKSSTEEETIGCLVMLVMMPFSAAWYGYALSVLWGWFVVPLFALPALPIAYGIGLAMTLRFIVNSGIETNNEHKNKSMTERVVEGAVKAFLSPALALLFGWIVTLFI